MSDNLMILPAKDCKDTCLFQIPDDLEQHEAFRHVTSLIAQVEQNNPEYQQEDIIEALEDRGFVPVPFILGPVID